jgi:hypothetical protein
MAGSADLIESLASRLPYADGTARRRLLAGALLVVGLAVPNREAIPQALGISYQQMLSSPILLLSAGLIVYVSGTIVELIGSSFLVRIAAGLFQAFEPLPPPAHDRTPVSASRAVVTRLWRVARAVSSGFVLGLMGRQSLNLSLADRLSPAGRSVFESLPGSVQRGLNDPIGDYRDLAIHYVTHSFRSSRSRQWCRRLISHVADVAVTTTAVITLVVPFAASLVDVMRAGPELQARSEYDRFATTTWQARNTLNEGVPPNVLATLENDEKGSSFMSPTAADDGTASTVVDFYLANRRDTPDGQRAPDRGQLDAYRTVIGGYVSTLQQARQPLPNGEPDELTRFRDQRIARWRAVQQQVELWASSATTLANVSARRQLLQIIVLVSAPLLLLLYRAYFATVRNAMVTILEAMAIERAGGWMTSEDDQAAPEIVRPPAGLRV